MAKSGQARVLTTQQQNHLFDEIAKHRHAEKNAAIMQISFKLGLRVQEIALLQLKEVCMLGGFKKGQERGFTLLEVMTLPAAYTKGADALGRSKTVYKRQRVGFSIEDFDRVVRQVEQLAKAGAEINPADFYPAVVKHKGKTRDLPLVDQALRKALKDYLAVRLTLDPSVKPTDPLFLSQKGGPYSPNTLQEHIALMLRKWAGVEKASSHSGRRSLATKLIHEKKKSVKVVQQILGHRDPSTTLRYEEPPEEEISDALSMLDVRNPKPKHTPPPLLQPQPELKTTKIILWLFIENNNSFVRGKGKTRQIIEDEYLREFKAKKLEKDGWEYELTFHYESDDDLEMQINDLVSKMNNEANLRNGFIECNFSEVGTERSW